MGPYLIRRLLLAVPTVLGVLIAVFLLIRLVPGDVVTQLIGLEASISPKRVDELKRLFGIDRPIPVQFADYMADVARGNLGKSLRTGRPVGPELARRFPVTIQLALMGLLAAIAIGIPVGILAALRRGRAADYVATGFVLLGLSVPSFWLAILIILLFSLRLGWLPPAGYVSPAEDMVGNLQHLLLPALSLGLVLAAASTRIVRSSLLEVLGRHYIRTARAKGLWEHAVVLRHALRNALIPIVTVIGLQFGTLLGGTVIIEQIFSLPGIGRYALEFVFFPDAIARTTAIRTGTVDFIEYVPSSEVRSLRGDPNVEVVGGPSSNLRAIHINTAVAPFNNVKVRQAMAWATNRKEIIDTALFGVGGIDATAGAIPPSNYFAVSKNVYDKVDLDRAKRLLAEAGSPNGFEADFYVTSTYDFLRTPAEIIQAQLAKIGIRLRIQAADWSVYLPTVIAKRYVLTLLGTSGQVDPDDYLYNNFHTGDARNYLNYSDAQFDKLVEEGQTTANEAQRKRIYDQAQLRLQETVPMVFLFHSTTFEALRKNVQGFEHWPNQSYYGLRRTWIAPR